jgi:hypothetical protein
LGKLKSNDIFKIEKRAIRNKMDSCKPYLKKLRKLTAYSIYILESAMFVKNTQHLFKTNGYHYNDTKNRNEFEKIMHRTLKFERSPYYYPCVKIFERIPNSIKYLPTKDFKNQLTRYLLDKFFYSLNQFYDDTEFSSSSIHQVTFEINVHWTSYCSRIYFLCRYATGGQRESEEIVS